MKEQETRPDPIRDYLNELYMYTYGIPLQWDLDLSKQEGQLGEVSKQRLQHFNDELERSRKPVVILSNSEKTGQS